MSQQGFDHLLCTTLRQSCTLSGFARSSISLVNPECILSEMVFGSFLRIYIHMEPF